MRSKYSLLLLALFSASLVKAQEPEIRIEVKEEKEKEEVKLPVEKKKNTPKTETTVREEQLQKSSGAGGVNVFRAVELTPSVHVGTDDAYGLGGGTITIRGFTNDQIGLEIDGMPLNDSGNYALYPHEYIDVENLEAITIERGATKKASPFYADIGGSIKLRTKPPKNRFGIDYNLRYGSFNFKKEFIRIDTGLIPKLGLKSFISFSHTEADKWKGPGKYPAYRDHLTLGIAQNLGRVRWEFYFDNNAQLNYFYRGLTYQQVQDLDKNRRLDYTDRLIFPGGAGTAHNDPIIRENNRNYYKFFKNPYDNREYRANIEIDLPYGAMLTLKPYYWWGRGNGTSTTTFTSGGNTYIAYRESYNYTDRPGIIADLKLKPTKDFDLHLGYWYEYAKLKQFQPSFPVKVNPDGSFTLITANTGTPRFQYNYIQLTKTYTNTPYILLEGTNLMSKLDISLGLKLGQVKRDFKSYRTTGVPYSPKDSVYDYPLQLDPNGSYSKTYRRVLPSFSVGYKLTNSIYPYFAYARNFRVPKNFLGSFPTGYTAQQIANNLKPELSDSFDLGVRFDYGTLYVVPSIYYVNYKDRIIYFTDPNNPNVSYPQNVGKVDAYGAELEVAFKPIKDLSIYSSVSYSIAKLKDSRYCTGTSASSCINIKDNQVPNTPKFMFKTGIDYKVWNLRISPSLQYVSSRYGNLTNTEKVSGYTLVNLNASADIYKTRGRNITAYLDIYNLFDKKFIGRISPGDTTGTYYVGAPFTVAVGIRGGF